MKTFIASIVLGIVAGTVIVSLFLSLFVLYKQNEQIAIEIKNNNKNIEHISILLNNTNIEWQR